MPAPLSWDHTGRMPPRILVFAGSLRTGSFNARLAALAAKVMALVDAEADVSLISLADYPMPLYDGNLEAASGAPAEAVKLKQVMCAHQGVFITSPEYNASLTPLLKNAIDWVSRVREKGEPPLAAYKNRAFALGAASNGSYGGMRSLMALRHVLELGCGALVIPEQVAVREAATAFDDDGSLKDARTASALDNAARRLVAMARVFA
jgi:chromate reductase, NAD(P)H dehydrogenase (quinone)